MKAPALAALVPALGLLLAGCATVVHVSQDFDPSADFSRYRTWEWMPGPVEQTGDPRIDNPLVAQRVRAAVESTMAARGFVRAGEAEPDLLVGFHLSLEQKLDVQTIDRYYGYGRYGRWGGVGSRTYVTQYDEGTLIIDFADARMEQLVWRGWAWRRLSRNPDPQRSTEIINAAVAQILSQYPPNTPPNTAGPPAS